MSKEYVSRKIKLLDRSDVRMYDKKVALKIKLKQIHQENWPLKIEICVGNMGLKE